METSLLAKSIMAFDHSYEPEIQLYNNLPYSRDLSVCEYGASLQMVSGNIVKFYQYKIGKPQIIQADDEEFEIPEYRKLSTVVDQEVSEDFEEFTPLDAFAEGEALVNDSSDLPDVEENFSETEEDALPTDEPVLPLDEFVSPDDTMDDDLSE